MVTSRTYTSFLGTSRVAAGDLEQVLRATKQTVDQHPSETVLIFDDETGTQIDFDFRGSIDEVLARLPRHPFLAPHAPEARRTSGPGRPKLGVVCREVCLLPRHWDWLELQPNGSSAVLRRLIDEARKREPNKERARAMRDAANKVMSSLAGNLPGYEEAARSLYARQPARFAELTQEWPVDLRDYLRRKVEDAERLESTPPAFT